MKRTDFIISVLLLAAGIIVAFQIPVAFYSEIASVSVLPERLQDHSNIAAWWGAVFWPSIVGLLVIGGLVSVLCLNERIDFLNRILFALTLGAALVVICYSALNGFTSLVVTGGMPTIILGYVLRIAQNAKSPGI